MVSPCVGEGVLAKSGNDLRCRIQIEQEGKQHDTDKDDFYGDEKSLLSFAGVLGNPYKKRRLSYAVAVVAEELQEVYADAKAYKSYDEHVRLDECGGYKKCARCHWERHRSKWQKRLCANIGGKNKSLIVERPAKWGGAWGVGCIVCAQANMADVSKVHSYGTFGVRARTAMRYEHHREHW